MNSTVEFDSEFCNVRYMEKDNVVLLTWKQFAQGVNYRTPTLFALKLLKEHPRCNFVVDARDGFEDAEEDAQWGFSELLPNMATTDCRFVAFIMRKETGIEEEMDMWTKEFGKYFAVTKSDSYEQAIESMKHLILVNVRYTLRPGTRNDFLEKVETLGIIRDSKAEPGNYKYEYYIPIATKDEIFLMELWVSDMAIKIHTETEHYQRLQALKKEYVIDVSIDKFNVSAW